LNLLFVILLNRLGISAQPVLLSTRSNGKINPLNPLVQNFNNTIVHTKLKGKRIFMDVTDPFSTPNFLPYRCLNKKYCVLGKDTTHVIENTPPKSVSFVMIDAEIDSLGAISNGTYNYSSSGYFASLLRENLKDNKEEGVYSSCKKNNPDFAVNNFKIENADKMFENIKLSFGFSSLESNLNSDKVIISPLLSEQMRKHSFKEKERIYPIDFGYPEEVIVIAKYRIPESYSISKLPKDYIINLPNNGGKFSYLTEVENNVIQVKSQILINKSFYKSEEYKTLKELHDMVLNAHAEQIVLKRKPK
jgi:hypothetical protein